MKQPCGGCGKNKQAKLTVQTLNTFLDAAEMNLQGAWLTDIPLEFRGAVGKLIEAIQALKTPQGPPPLETQLAGLVNITSKVVQQIQCEYCRKASYYDLVESVRFHLELEKRHYWHAFKILVKKEILKSFWLVLALYFRLVRPWLIRHHCRKLLH